MEQRILTMQVGYLAHTLTNYLKQNNSVYGELFPRDGGLDTTPSC